MARRSGSKLDSFETASTNRIRPGTSASCPHLLAILHAFFPPWTAFEPEDQVPLEPRSKWYELDAKRCPRSTLMLSDGRAPREIAEKVGVTDNTVRSQIKSIFSKTGVRRQSDLVRLLLNSAQPTIQTGA